MAILDRRAIPNRAQTALAVPQDSAHGDISEATHLLSDKQNESCPHVDDDGAPSLWTVLIPLLAGTAVYVVFTEISEWSKDQTVWWEELFETAPAVMVGLLFEEFVLLPLRILFVHSQIRDLLVFLGVSALVWLAISAVILSGTTALNQRDLWTDASVMLPGLILAGVFTLMTRDALRR